jgi:hypothetical protein
MAFGSATFGNVSGAVSDIFSSQATAGQLRIKAQGDVVEGQNYLAASKLARQNEQFTEEFTSMQQTMADRQIYQGLGTTKADIAGAGFAESGSALDLLRDSAAQGALQKQIIGRQGEITEAGYTEQAQAYNNLSAYANYAATQENRLAGEAIQHGQISAAIHIASAVGTLFV